ncbi:MAG TPA: sigma-54 dependent transcriptional regulator [Methylomirabilota bacterium]|jgi:two-component system response regulator AtoC|nr:sigma-54 dependent transcriptional regulator [Methylomirabilota bacterium]
MIGNRYVNDFAPLLGQSPKMRAVQEIVESIADTDATVLIRGESGVGKDVVARAIHASSSRHDKPFVKVNCAALPAGLLESELFGHEKGAFTGAYRRNVGKFEYAHLATIYLDEIGEMPLALQAKLLHVLQDFQFCRIGGQGMIRVDARVIAATNRHLETALKRGDFREDLYYRLNVVEITVPPLRERREEIRYLAHWFLEKFNAQYQRQRAFTPELLELLEEQQWSGNVRELENIVRRFIVLSNPDHVHQALLAGRRGGHAARGPAQTGSFASVADGLREIARRGAREAERKALAEVLEQVHWNRAEAARILKVSYKTLLNKISECRLVPESSGKAL